MFGGRTSFVVCCQMLFVDCCLLCVLFGVCVCVCVMCCMLCVACWLLFVVCCLSYDVCCSMCVVWCVLVVVRVGCCVVAWCVYWLKFVV